MDDGTWIVEIDSHGDWPCRHCDRTGNPAPPNSLSLTQAITENPNADAEHRRGHLWCPDCGTYWRVWEHSRVAKQYIALPSVTLVPPEGLLAPVRYRRLPIRDIDRVIVAGRGLITDLEVTQYQQSWPNDDDGLWFFGLPNVDKQIQIESWTGECPFIVEHSDMKSSSEAETARSVEEAVDKVVAYLTSLKGNAGRR